MTRPTPSRRTAARTSEAAFGEVGPVIPPDASAEIKTIKTFMDNVMEVIKAPDASHSGDMAKLAAVITNVDDSGAVSSFTSYCRSLDSVHAILLRVLLLRYLPTGDAALIVKGATAT